MNLRENVNAILHYEKFDRFPVLSMGYWKETLEKWANEGHIRMEDAQEYMNCVWKPMPDEDAPAVKAIREKLGFDYNWDNYFRPKAFLFPEFEREVLEVKPDGSRIIRDPMGLIVMEKPGVISIPAEIGTTLTDRQAWEEFYLPKFQWNPERTFEKQLKDRYLANDHEYPLVLQCGSLIGDIRNMMGLTELSYLYVDDPELYGEILDTVGNLSYQCVKHVLETGVKFDAGHFWEDICCRNGPLVPTEVFEEYLVPHYRKITSLLLEYGIDIVTVDCDGDITHLVKYWLEGGVNTMFPIEVGAWGGSFAPLRNAHGKALRGIGGMNKNVFSKDYKAIDEEIERLKPIMAMGGYIPCPDHLIAPDSKFENVQYYCDKMHHIKI